MRTIVMFSLIIALCLVNSGCFEVLFGVSASNVSPGETVDVTATIATSEGGEFVWTQPVYLEIPASWTLVYVESMTIEGRFNHLGITSSDFERGAGDQYTQPTETNCSNGVYSPSEPYTPRPGYQGFALQFLSSSRGGNGAGWVAIRAHILVGGETGQYTIRAWGGTPDMSPTHSNIEQCVFFETPISVGLLFADGFESGDTLAWSGVTP